MQQIKIHSILKTMKITTIPQLPLIIVFLLLLVPLLTLLSLSYQTAESSVSKTRPDNDLIIRPGYATYESYLTRQLQKTLNPKLRQIWTTRDWDRKVEVFSLFFLSLQKAHLLSNHSKALCVGARVGQEVAALKRVGVSDSVGIDLVPYPPLVVHGDFHSQPFDDERFDFEFSNVFDHALFPEKFVGEIERTLKPGGVCVLHVLISKRADKYSANDLFSVKPLIKLFKHSEVVHVKNIDGFGLDTEVVFRKKLKI